MASMHSIPYPEPRKETNFDGNHSTAPRLPSEQVRSSLCKQNTVFLFFLGECKSFKEKFMKCLRDKNFENALCRNESKEYLMCRMQRRVPPSHSDLSSDPLVCVGCCEPLCGCWELSPGPLNNSKQEMLSHLPSSHCVF